MGAFGLDNLHYFVVNRNEEARAMLSASHHPITWFNMGIVCVNITLFIVELLNCRLLHPMLYANYLQLIQPHNLMQKNSLVLHVIRDLYCVLNIEFMNKWQDEECTLIQFDSFFKLFRAGVKRQLKIDYLKYLIKT
eukprot:NODE_335_length_10686_cov_0.203363.p9 type:complete len:136 gc:universal NODE_335_length_10686_cov_0.203363:4347-4754(+)